MVVFIILVDFLVDFSRQPWRQPPIFRDMHKKKKHRQSFDYQCFFFVGVTRFELATPRPPDVYSNRAELHPELIESGYWGFIHRFRTAKIRTIFKKQNHLTKKMNFLVTNPLSPLKKPHFPPTKLTPPPHSKPFLQFIIMLIFPLSRRGLPSFSYLCGG